MLSSDLVLREPGTLVATGPTQNVFDAIIAQAGGPLLELNFENARSGVGEAVFELPAVVRDVWHDKRARPAAWKYAHVTLARGAGASSPKFFD